jgi:microcystin-dependent protein
MAKIKRNITLRTDGKNEISRKPMPWSRRIRRFIPFLKPTKPIPDIISNDSESEIGTPEENTSTSNTGSTGSTDPGTATSASTSSSTMEPFIGEIKMFAGNFAPRGWAFCDGQLLLIRDYTALFSIFGKIYGGDGVTNFALPDMRGRVPIHPGQGANLSNYTPGQTGGSETVTLSTSEMPNHNHSVMHADATADSIVPTNKMIAPGDQTIYGEDDQQSAMNTNMIGKTGGAQAHRNIQPYLGINFIIALEGVFPGRS